MLSTNEDHSIREGCAVTVAFILRVYTFVETAPIEPPGILGIVIVG
jgi:hypothetical protein